MHEDHDQDHEQDHEQESPAQGKGGAAGAGRRADPGAAFEIWLQQRLHQLYDGVTSEPIPPELLRLIEEDRSRRGR